MSKSDIIDRIEDMGFPYLATLLTENQLTYLEALGHVLDCYASTTDEEFSSEDCDRVELLLQNLFEFSQPINQPTK